MRLRQLLSIALTLAVGAHPVLAQPDACDPNLVQPIVNPYGYRLRGERCEGIYVEQVGGPPLLIASWTEYFPEYDLRSPMPLRLQWDSAGISGAARVVRVRAQSLRRRLYYRMDAVRTAGSTSFTWPFELLSVLKIPRSDVGVVATTRAPVAGTERDVFLPLRVRQGEPTPHPGGYGLVLLPGVELEEVFVGRAELSREPALQNTVSKPLGYGYYPADRPIEIPIPGPRATGIYYLRIGATLKSGGASTAEFRFFHKANREPPQ